MHRVCHLVSGGLYPDGEGGWRHAGPGVLALAKDPLFQQLMGLAAVEAYGKAETHSSKGKSIGLLQNCFNCSPCSE
jgi:hypothetical protein